MKFTIGFIGFIALLSLSTTNVQAHNDSNITYVCDTKAFTIAQLKDCINSGGTKASDLVGCVK